MSTKARWSIAARRTPEIESLIQELWSLSPELRELGTVTILLALAALTRKSKRILTIPLAPVSGSAPFDDIDRSEAQKQRAIQNQ